MMRRSKALKTPSNPCIGCDEYCLACVEDKKHLRRNPYPLPVREEKKEHYYSYLRWVLRHRAAIKHYANRHYEPADEVEEIKWLLKHPKVAYQLINSDQIQNNTKVARILSRVLDPANDYMAGMIIGRPGMGKTTTSLWLAENAYLARPERNYRYLTYTKKIDLPKWIEPVTSINDIPNDCFLITDEGGIQAPARRAMRKENVTLGQLLNVRRHKSLQLFWIAQEPEDVDRSIRRQMDYFFLKPYSFTSTNSSLMQRLYAFTPSGKNFHKLGFYDSTEGVGFKCWQPAPKSFDPQRFSKTYEDADITKSASLIDEPEKEGKKKDVPKKEKKIKAKYFKWLKWNEEGKSEREISEMDEVEVKKSAVHRGIAKAREHIED